MATAKFIASKLREFDPVGCADLDDGDVIDVANRCQCGRRIFSDEELQRFISLSESANDFLGFIYLRLPKRTPRRTNGNNY